MTESALAAAEAAAVAAAGLAFPWKRRIAGSFLAAACQGCNRCSAYLCSAYRHPCIPAETAVAVAAAESAGTAAYSAAWADPAGRSYSQGGHSPGSGRGCTFLRGEL